MRFTVLAIINILMVIIGIITISVSIGYLPSTGGTVPQEMTLEQYQAQQHTTLLNSTAFKWVIAGSCITGSGILMALIRIYYDNKRETERYNRTVLPLEVKREKPVVIDVAKQEPISMPIAKQEPMAKPMAKPTNAPRGPVIYHEPMPYRIDTKSIIPNIPDSRWQTRGPPRPILYVKRKPIVEII